MIKPSHIEDMELSAIQSKAIGMAIKLENVPLECATVELNSADIVSLAHHHGMVCVALEMLKTDRDVAKIVDEAPAGSLAPIAVALGLDQDAPLEDVYRAIRDLRSTVQAREGRVLDLGAMAFELGLPAVAGFERQLAAAAELRASVESLREKVKPDGPKVRKLKARVMELLESEEKAWQTVAKLRIELQTTDRIRTRVAELEAHADDVEESQSLAARERDTALARVTELEEGYAAYQKIAEDRVAKLEVELKGYHPL